MEPIDIVVPYVNCNDPHWLYYYGIYRPNTKPNERFEETYTLKYQLRSIEKNVPWVNKIYLVLAFESQIPEWLDPHAEKLKIVYHKDFIPHNLLPTFNSGVIIPFVNRIPGLSNHFIITNDDMIFTAPNMYYRYFAKNKAVNYIKIIDENYKIHDNGLFTKIRYNSVRYFNEYVNSGKMIKYADWHLPQPYIKEVWDDVWNNFGQTLAKTMYGSKFRVSKNINEWMFYYISAYQGSTIHAPIDHKGYLLVKDTVTYDDIQTLIDDRHPCMCLNDGIKTKHIWWKTIDEMLKEVFPDKSHFEK